MPVTSIGRSMTRAQATFTHMPQVASYLGARSPDFRCSASLLCDGDRPVSAAPGSEMRAVVENGQGNPRAGGKCPRWTFPEIFVLSISWSWTLRIWKGLPIGVSGGRKRILQGCVNLD
jgi:hypothetical protein